MRFILPLLLALVFSSPTMTQAKSQGGFSGPGSTNPATTVSQAQNLPDDSAVILTGNIVSQLPDKDDKYLFRDSTGEIIVDIDEKDFRGQKVTPANVVRITGEIDKDFGRKAEVDVEYLEVLQ